MLASSPHDPLAYDGHSESRQTATLPATRWWKNVTLKRLIGIASETGRLWSTQHVARTAAALGFYTLFSLAPMLVIVTAIAGAVWGREAVQGELVTQLAQVVGPDGGRLIQEMIANAYRSTGTGFSALAGIVAVLIGASAVFAELRYVMEGLWGREQKSSEPLSRVVLGLVKARLRGLAIVVGSGFVLLASLVLSSVLVAVLPFFKPVIDPLVDRAPVLATLLALVPLAFSIALTTAILALLLSALVPVSVPKGRLIGAALFGAIVFDIAKSAVSLYLGHSAVTSTFGAAGSLAVLLFWLYVASAIVLLCAVVLRAMGPPAESETLTASAASAQGIKASPTATAPRAVAPGAPAR